MPRAMVMVPSVAMKGGSLHLATSWPLSTPTKMQQTKVIPTATQGLIPLVINVAEIIQLIPTTEPMERSMLPVIRT